MPGKGREEGVAVRLGEGARAVFVLAAETDPEQGEIDLTRALEALIASGLRNPRANPPDGVPFGYFETEGDIVVTAGGSTLSEEKIAEAVCSGFLNAIHAALDAAHASSPEEAGEGGGRPEEDADSGEDGGY